MSEIIRLDKETKKEIEELRIEYLKSLGTEFEQCLKPVIINGEEYNCMKCKNCKHNIMLDRERTSAMLAPQKNWIKYALNETIKQLKNNNLTT